MPPTRPPTSPEAIADLLDRNQRYLDAMAGQNDLHCDALMLNHALAESTALLRNLLASPLPVGAAARYRHLKRGSAYIDIARGPLQASTEPPAEGDIIVCYRGDDGRHFFRKATEFDDGRFERLPDEPWPAQISLEMRRLIIAARCVAFDSCPGKDELHELDKASEAFAEAVPWDDQPEDDPEGGSDEKDSNPV